MTPAHTPGVGSLGLRVALGVVAAFLLTAVPENLATWDDPASSVVPSQRIMPEWGIWAMGALMAGVIVVLALGWMLRRGGAAAMRGRWTAIAWAVVAGLAVWSAILAVSQVAALDDGGGPVGPGAVLDGLLAIVSIATGALVLRDLGLLRHGRQPAPQTAAGHGRDAS